MLQRLLGALAAFKFAWDAYPSGYSMQILDEDALINAVCQTKLNLTIAPDDFENTALVEYSEYRNITKH